MTCPTDEGAIKFTDNISSDDIKRIYEGLGEPLLPTPPHVVRQVLNDLMGQHVARGFEALEAGDNLGAAQAAAQTVAITAAMIAGTLFGFATSVPMKGLDIVFKSIKDKGFLDRTMDAILKNLGESANARGVPWLRQLQDPLVRKRFLNLNKGIAGGAAAGYGGKCTNKLDKRNLKFATA